MDAQLRFLTVNEAYSKVFLCPPDAMIGKTIMEMFSHDPEHLEAVVRPNLEEALTGVDSSYGVWVDIPELGRRYFEILARPIVNEQKVIERIAIIGRDRTDMQSQLDELQRSREMLNRTEKIANLGGWFADIKSGVMTWTDEMYAIHEVDRDFDVDPVKIMHQFYSKDQHAVMDAWMEKARNEEGPHEVIGMMETPKGNRKWVCSIAFTRWDNGELVSIEGVLQDITKTHELEQELKHSEEKFRSLVEETNAVVWEVDLDPIRYTYLSPQAVTQTGYSMEEWKKEAFMESIMHPEDKPAVMEKIYNNLTVGKNFSLEYRIIKKDGSYMWIHDNIRPIKNIRNQVVGARGVFIDVSSIEQMKAGLYAAFRSISTYEEALNQHAIVSVADKDGR